MNRRTVTIISALFLFLAVISHGSAAEPTLRHKLEKAWQAYLAASDSGKESELEKTMSSFRLATMKNNLASAKRSLTPAIIKNIAQNSPGISSAEFVTLLEQGATAGLVYVKDSEDKDASDKPRVTFVFIKFVKEQSGWKVDAGINVGSPKFQDNGKKSEFDPSDLPPTYEIDGQVRSAPKPSTAPQVSALLDVFCPGYNVTVTVNGVEHETFTDKSYSGLLKCGLRKGKNSIVIVITQAKKDASFEPRVNIRRILEDRKTEVVFKFEPKENIAGKHMLTFTIDE